MTQYSDNLCWFTSIASGRLTPSQPFPPHQAIVNPPITVCIFAEDERLFVETFGECLKKKRCIKYR